VNSDSSNLTISETWRVWSHGGLRVAERRIDRLVPEVGIEVRGEGRGIIKWRDRFAAVEHHRA
jgi:hypothetical protein